MIANDSDTYFERVDREGQMTKKNDKGKKITFSLTHSSRYCDFAGIGAIQYTYQAMYNRMVVFVE